VVCDHQNAYELPRRHWWEMSRAERWGMDVKRVAGRLLVEQVVAPIYRRVRRLITNGRSN